jgi:hypothetical protein
MKKRSIEGLFQHPRDFSLTQQKERGVNVNVVLGIATAIASATYRRRCVYPATASRVNNCLRAVLQIATTAGCFSFLSMEIA